MNPEYILNNNRCIIGYILLSVSSYLARSQLLGLSEGASCGNVGGVCRRLRECPVVGNPRVSRPLLCSFIDREPVVCCPPSIAQEMCMRYDRMACNGVDSNRRRRDIEDESDPLNTRSRLPVDLLDSLMDKEASTSMNFSSTTERHLTSTITQSYTTTETRSSSTTTRVYLSPSTTTRHYQSTSTTSRLRQPSSTTTRINQATTTQSTRTTTYPSRTTITPTPTTMMTNATSSSTILPDHLLNETGEDGAATRMLLFGGIANVDNDVPDTKIVGGIAAMPRELPYMALIGFGTGNFREWSCGASIISENFVLSAAHCAQDARLGAARWVRVAELDLAQENSPHQDIAIRNIYVHPDYRAPAVYNDIALYRLERTLQFSSWIQPICLQVSPDVLSNKGIAAGWGRTDFVGETSSRLLKVDLSMVDTAQCRNLLGRAGRFLPQGVNTNTMICAGENEGGKDTCTGDSGGPLVVQGNGRCIRTQIGVVSFGRQCAMPNTPGIYTRVSSFIPWIESIVWPR